MNRRDPGKYRSKHRLLLLLLKGWRRTPRVPEMCRKTATASCSSYLSPALSLVLLFLPPSTKDVFPPKVDKGGLCGVIAAVKQKLSPLQQQVSPRAPQLLFLSFPASSSFDFLSDKETSFISNSLDQIV